MQRDIALMLAGIGTGLGLMYFLDPGAGKRRRARASGRARHARTVVEHGTPRMMRDLAHRVRGFVAESQRLVRQDAVDDDTLHARVRSRLGRVVSHPSAVEVNVNDGRVTLSGPVLADELHDLLDTVARIRGVSGIDNRLEAHRHRNNVSALQGGVAREYRPELLQENWAPATRLGMGLSAAALIVGGLRRRSPGGNIMTLAGTGLLVRTASNLPLRRITGIGAGRRAVILQKTAHIHAPVEDVYAFWENFETFPVYLASVLDVKAASDNVSHWRVRGPFGIPIAWDAEVTTATPNRLLGWKTKDDALVQHAGLIHFDREDDGTRVHIQMHYNPPGGVVGALLAKAVGRDAKTILDSELVRIKTFLETGTRARDAARASA